MTSTLQKANGPAATAIAPDRGSNNPSQDIQNMTTDNIAAPKRQDALHRAKDVINDAQYLIHAAWMAAGALDRDDHAAEQDALRSVLHLAGERLSEAEIALERAQNGRASA
ncbi:hypothetical protein [Aquamicrobium soli]|uniref:Uncharacterized protein n=1 Tax=Aquamicrobium soli TaxID=1811518 RepID=A0ABV7KFT3_9HYPH